MYSVEQAEDILNRIHSIRKSLIIGKQEKYELMQVGGGHLCSYVRFVIVVKFFY